MFGLKGRSSLQSCDFLYTQRSRNREAAAMTDQPTTGNLKHNLGATYVDFLVTSTFIYTVTVLVISVGLVS